MSGFNVTSMVSEMMTTDYTKLNQLLGTEQTTQWTEDRERTEITNLNNFGNTYFQPDSSNYVLSSDSFLAYTANSSDTTSATATALNTATAGNYTINSATMATAASASYEPGANGITNSSTIANLGSVLSNGGTEFQNGGALSFTVTNSAGVATNVSYNLDANATVGQVMDDLSSQTGLKFSYSELNNSFSVANQTTGDSSNCTISTTSSTTADFLNTLFGTNTSGTSSASNTSNTSGTTTNASGTTTTLNLTGGNDGTFSIQEPGGQSNTALQESSNNFTIDGVNYNITNNISSSSPVTINVASNVSGVVSQIQNFVNAYNNLTSGINSTLNEKTNYNYKTLTYTQESQMNSSQISAWNDQVQQGLLSGNENLTNLQNEMRQAFYEPVSGTGLTMSNIGLSTSDDPTQGGVLTLNTATLTSELQKDPNAVINLLTQASSTTPSNMIYPLSSSNYQSVYNGEGIFQRLSDIVTKYASTTPISSNGTRGILVNEAGAASDPVDNSTLGQTLTQEQTAVTDQDTQITSDKSMYTTQYTALQTALSSISNQESAVSSMLGSSSSSS
jgi:flagellar hook-associated protein 2